MKRILCLSGGGIRGVAQLQVLKSLELSYGKPLYEVYDLIIGTSVGAINAAIIATGKISMVDLDKRYDNIIHNVFKRRGLFRIPKYDRNNFIQEWNNLIGDYYFSDAKTKLMITTVDLVSDTNIFYKSWHSDFQNNNIQMSDIVMRSFAAPVYFGQIVDYENKMVYSDGGIGNANLPLNEAKLQAETFEWYNGTNEVEIHAIGTLFDATHPPFEKVSKGRWLKQLMEYINLKHGGFARVQSREDQIRMMKYICNHNNSIKFKYWDNKCENKYLILDGIDYISIYRELGYEMSKKPLLEFN